MKAQEIPFSSLLFKVLAGETRLRIALSLVDGDRSVSSICEKTGLEQPRVSHELRCLATCGLVKFSKEGRHVVYSLNKETILPILEAADEHVKIFGERIGRCDTVSEAKRVSIYDTGS